MADMDNYTVMKNEETGAEVYHCNVCISKYGTKKAIRTHMTTKHKPKKKVEEKNEDNNEDAVDDKNDNKTDEKIENEVSEFNFDREEGNGSSTQVDKPVALDDIFKFYETNNEFLKDDDTVVEKSSTTIVIPDDTMDDIMSRIEENRKSDEPSGDKDDTGDLFTENMLLKSKLKSTEESIKINEQKVLEAETSLIDANTELEKVKEEV